MGHWRLTRRALIPTAALVVGLTATACSSTPSPDAASTTTTAASSTTTTPTTGSATTTTVTLVPQSATSTEFYAPSGNLECEIDSQFGPSSQTQAMCLTVSPPQSATLGADSSLKKCTGQTCLSNAGLNTPQLPYGSSITLGPFTCLSMTTGMKCTLDNGNGFVLAKSGVTPLGSVAVTTTASG